MQRRASVTRLAPVIQILRQLLQQLLEHVVVQILRDVVEEQPVAEVILVSDLEHVPRIVLAGAGHGEHNLVERRAPARRKTADEDFDCRRHSYFGIAVIAMMTLVRGARSVYSFSNRPVLGVAGRPSKFRIQPCTVRSRVVTRGNGNNDGALRNNNRLPRC